MNPGIWHGGLEYKVPISVLSRIGTAAFLVPTAFSAPPVATILPSTKGQTGYTQGGQPKVSFSVILLMMYFPARLEPKMFSEPTDCQPDRERCIVHSPSRMMQIYSLKLSQIPIDNKSVELYGYIAVRDYHDSLLNYIVNRSRDDPIIVHQGSLIPMTGPKRGISMSSTVLLEFDMRIKKGEPEENDLQLIDGASEICEVTAPMHVYTTRIEGDCGAVDITSALVYEAVEATIEVVVPEVLSGFSLSLSSLVLIYGSRKEIQLFHGTICESCALRRSVIAVGLKFKIRRKGSKNGLERYCSFKAANHGCARRQIMLDIASISAKVTWSTDPL
ncbi:uncharacterized protein LOC100845732 [Brachypodium distachyon]|uniref:DUF6598 domain-containing protein n=1 Tax=Brachypodium distachyon TaxID=15368 RepID=I1GL51_BRADI|nr:uncharacterized protein LOC100845732 [Brachypodium distachyon]KQK12259.1 hypothetical protein BRADI_1g02505v3 [Brachypodium distachyon]|eukprot:XP_010237948.1 uncharacterized protein LOC100845732 [Brachypodium distachyon]